MSHRSSTPYSVAVLLCCSLLLGASGSADEEPTPRPTPQPTPTPTPGPTSLADLARNLELNTEAEDGQGLVISNSNLSDYASKGQLTGAASETTGSAAKNKPRPARPGRANPDEAEVPQSPELAKEQEQMEFWRGRYERQLNNVETVKAKIRQLDLEIPQLWTKFYAWDDPAYRDGVIKVRLDQALEERDRLTAQLAEQEAELARIKVEARRDGALPGWFRGLPTPTP